MTAGYTNNATIPGIQSAEAVKIPWGVPMLLSFPFSFSPFLYYNVK